MYILILCLASFAFGYFLGTFSKKEIILPIEKKKIEDTGYIFCHNRPKKNEFTTTLSIYTFNRFWTDFHKLNNLRKLDKEKCYNLWKYCHFYDRKKKAILEIEKTDKTAFEYLKTKLTKP